MQSLIGHFDLDPNRAFDIVSFIHLSFLFFRYLTVVRRLLCLIFALNLLVYDLFMVLTFNASVWSGFGVF